MSPATVYKCDDVTTAVCWDGDAARKVDDWWPNATWTNIIL